MGRLIPLLLALAGAAAAARMLWRRRSRDKEPAGGVMPRPTAAPAAAGAPTAPGEAGQPSAREPDPDPEPPPMPPTEPDPSPAAEPSPSPGDETPGPIDEGEPGAITAAPVPEEPEPEPAPAPDDSALERAVESEIAEDPEVPHEGVEVDVEDGVAQLRGSVPDEETATRIGDDAGRVDGVIGLDDQLDRPDEPEAAEGGPERSG
jgi:BON domain